MISNTEEEVLLKEQLRSQPERFEYRYDNGADLALLQILYKSLAGQRDDYLRFFFPNGTPSDPKEPWSLRAAQGAIDGAEYLPSAKGTACGHIFKSGESTYSCKTCAADETCVLCSKCFESSDHEGHQVYVSVSPGNSGCCDCGDSEAWRREVKCSIHTATNEEDPHASGKQKEAGPAGSQLPPELMQAVRMTIARAVDYLCDVFSCSPEQLRLPKSDESILEDERSSRLSAATYGPEDQTPATEFAVVLWNDEKHTVTGVQNQVAKACRAPKSFGLKKAYEVNDNGRSIVHYGTDVAECVRIAKVLEQIKVTVTVRSSRDTFREQMCETIIDWMADIAGCAVGNEAYLLRNILCEEFLRPWRMGSAASNKDIGLAGIDDHEIDETNKLKKQYANFLRPQPPGFVRVEVDIGDDDDEAGDEDDENEDDDDDEDDETYNEDEDDILEDQMEILIEDIRQEVATAAPGDTLMADDFRDDGQAGPAGILTTADFLAPPPPPPPTAGQRTVRRHRILTPTESEDGEMESSQSQPPQLTTDAPFNNVPKTPGKQKVTVRKPQKPSRHWLEKPNAYRGPRPSEPAEDFWQRVRLDWLILYDLRLWKTLRIKLRHMYITNVATIPQFKRILGLRFAGLYTPLAELYLVADREPDHSIINLSVQMLTTPTITEEVVERGNFLTNLMAILYTFLTTRQVGFPEEIGPKATLAFDAGSVTNRRMFHFFVDMRWLLQSEYIHKQMRVEPRYMLQFLDLVKLHQGICPNLRATGAHVEYESDAWISASLIIKEIDRLCKAVASSFAIRSPECDSQLQRAIRMVGQVTMINSFGCERGRFHAHENRDEMSVHYIGHFDDSARSFSVPKFVVQQEFMSFHHPLHYLLSWLLEHAKNMSREEIRGLLHFTSTDLNDPYNKGSTYKGSVFHPPKPDELLCSIFDHPLRLCVWLSQMKAGMWVRNGITLRHQAHTYRSVSHRDISYQRDLFMVQAGLALCGSDTEQPGERFLAQMIDRFQIVSWMQGDFALVAGFDHLQRMDVLEDFYHLLIVALSDRGNLVPGNGDAEVPDRVIQHDVAHILCFKPLSFSDLHARVTEKIAESDSFQRVLEDMTNYRAPEGLSDTGTFELKQDFVALVDPYYAYYSRNHREEADALARKHVARKTGKKLEDIVFEPQLQSLDGGLFANLPDATRTPLFATVVAAALQYAIEANPEKTWLPATRIETFLHMVLHLALIATLEEHHKATDGFIVNATTDLHYTLRGSPWNIVSVLNKLSEKSEYASCLPAIKNLLRRMQERQPERLAGSREDRATPSEKAEAAADAETIALDDKEKKKRDAMARQARVMAQMKQQQNSFLQNQGLAGFEDDDFFDDVEDDTPMTEESINLEAQRKTWAFPTGTCILCQEETDDQRLYGTFAFIGESNILRSTPVDDPDFVQEVLQVPDSLDRSADHHRPFGVAGKNKQVVQKTTGDGRTADFERQGLSKGFPHAQHSTTGPVSTTCGHIMHFSCFELYLAATQRRQHQQIARSHPETIANKEFICPLCKALGNTFLPIIWQPKECVHEHELHGMPDFNDWLVTAETAYVPNLEFLEQHTGGINQLQQGAAALETGRLSQYANDAFVPSLSSALIDLRTAAMGRAMDDVNRRGSGSFWRNVLRPSTVANAFDANATPEVQPRLAELIKAYQRVEDTIRANRLNGAPGAIYGAANYAQTLSRSIGFSVSAVEIQLRGTSNGSDLASSLIADLSEQNLTHLRIMSETMDSWLAVNHLRTGAHDHDIAIDVACKRAVMIGQLFGADEETTYKLRVYSNNSLFEDDTFLFLADWLAYYRPTASEAASMTQLCLWAEIAKVVFSYKDVLGNHTDLQYPETTKDQDAANHDFECTVKALLADNFIDADTNSPYTRSQIHVLRTLVEKYAQTFLRKSIILMHVRYGLDFTCPRDLDITLPELNRLTSLLHISSVDALCLTYNSNTSAGRYIRRVSSRWLSQARTILSTPYTRIPIKLPHPAIFELVGLPKNYDVLTEEAIKRRCPTTGKEVSDAAVCLFCAEIFCSQATCCMKGPEIEARGGCWQHMQKCGGHIGIFINIRKCMVLFLHEPMHGSFAHAPYLDRHGEPDPTLRRHHQLFLNQRRYDKLMRDVWLGHGVQTFISRKLEADINPGGWETL